MAITYTDNLNLPIVPADNTNWEAEYNAMIEKLDRNPGIRIVADEAAMAALDTWAGRMCWRNDSGSYYVYTGETWEAFVITAYVEVDNFEHRDAYDGATTYYKYNMVYYEPADPAEIGTYICQDDNDGAGIVGVLPTDTAYWKFAFPATVGPEGPEGPAGPQGEPGEDGTVEGVVGPKKSVTQETTASVAASGSVTGSVSFDCSPHTGAEAFLLKVNVNPGAAISGFKFQLFATQSDRDAGTNPVYELDTAEDSEYSGGEAVRDPNAGYDTISYFIDDDAAAAAETGNLWYKVENLDTETASAFVIDIDYKGIV